MRVGKFFHSAPYNFLLLFHGESRQSVFSRNFARPGGFEAVLYFPKGLVEEIPEWNPPEGENNLCVTLFPFVKGNSVFL